MGVYEGVRVLSTTGHMVLLRLGQSPRGRGSLLPWGQTGLLQGSGDSGVGGGGTGAALPTCQWSQMPSLSSGDGRQGPGRAFLGT